VAGDVWSALIRINPRVLTPTTNGFASSEWTEAGTETSGLAHSRPVAVKLVGLEPDERRALTECAATRDVTVREGRQGERRPVLVAGSVGAVAALPAALAEAGCEALSAALGATLEAVERRHFRLALPDGGEVCIGGRPLVMGVVNVTPDSFSAGGRFLDSEAAAAHGLALSAAGADLIDVGGESTRPGAAPVTAADELRRVLPVVRALAEAGAAAVSIDTSKAEVAAECVRAGAAIVNDVTALFGDDSMAETVADLGVPVCVMHMRGTPRTMQVDPRYDDLMGEIVGFLRRSMAHGIARGVEEARFVVDPGIGFGKTADHNLVILKRLGQLRSLGRPILVGTSRKSFIGKVLADEDGDRPVDGRLMGTAASVALAVAHGAHLVRVHDVDAMRDVVRVVRAIETEQSALSDQPSADEEHPIR